MQYCEVLTPLKGMGAQNVSTFYKGERENFYPVLSGGEGGGAKSSGPRIFPFCSPLPLCNQ